MVFLANTTLRYAASIDDLIFEDLKTVVDGKEVVSRIAFLAEYKNPFGKHLYPEIPPYYYDQMQMQMAVWIKFWPFYKAYIEEHGTDLEKEEIKDREFLHQCDFFVNTPTEFQR